MRKIISAMNAYIGSKDLFDQPGWIFEPKLDGFRGLLYVNKDLTFLSRNNLKLNDRFPDLEGFRKNIKAESCILDGEIIALDDKGTPRIEMLGIKPSIYVVFDILEKNGEKLIDKPLYERKKILDETIKNGKKIKKIIYTSDGKYLWKIMLKRNFEGVMAKQFDAKYYPGLRTRVWLKIKNLNTADCVIIGYTITSRRELSSLALGLYDEHGNLKYIGKVGTGFTQDLLNELLTDFENYKTEKAPIKENVKLKNIQWIKPHFVAEIKFLEFTPDFRIRHSAFKKLRPDKKPRQCTIKANVPPR